MNFNVEIIGLIATTFVLISFLLSGEKRIRQINIIGSFIFVVYGLVLGALSVWVLNGVLFFVHIYKLYKISRKDKKQFNESKTIYSYDNKQIQK